jgi:TusA-related sulfurtransferase
MTATRLLDARGLRCPQPTLKIAVAATQLQPGDELEVIADCASFETDLRDFCRRSGRLLVWLRDEPGAGPGPTRVRRALLRM